MARVPQWPPSQQASQGSEGSGLSIQGGLWLPPHSNHPNHPPPLPSAPSTPSQPPQLPPRTATIGTQSNHALPVPSKKPIQQTLFLPGRGEPARSNSNPPLPFLPSSGSPSSSVGSNKLSPGPPPLPQRPTATPVPNSSPPLSSHASLQSFIPCMPQLHFVFIKITSLILSAQQANHGPPPLPARNLPPPSTSYSCFNTPTSNQSNRNSAPAQSPPPQVGHSQRKKKKKGFFGFDLNRIEKEIQQFSLSFASMFKPLYVDSFVEPDEPPSDLSVGHKVIPLSSLPEFLSFISCSRKAHLHMSMRQFSTSSIKRVLP